MGWASPLNYVAGLYIAISLLTKLSKSPVQVAVLIGNWPSKNFTFLAKNFLHEHYKWDLEEVELVHMLRPKLECYLSTIISRANLSNKNWFGN